jgi:hypothetical protein
VKIPNAEEAVVDPEKLYGYLLSASHPIGRFKAKFFARLGFEASNWQRFEGALREHLGHEAKLAHVDKHGQRYEICAILKGPAGESLVISAWIIRIGETAPRFVTAYPGAEL